jgi:hypothetical protein
MVSRQSIKYVAGCRLNTFKSGGRYLITCPSSTIYSNVGSPKVLMNTRIVMAGYG